MRANEELQAAIAEKMEHGISRERAAAAVFRENPELRERVIAEANEGRGPRRSA